MNDSIISFTKIEIVQLKVNGEIKHELPTSDFINRLKNAIIGNVAKNQVIYNENNGTYEIFHNSKKYQVYYGNVLIDSKCNEIDTLQSLNSLVAITNEQKSKQGYKEDITLCKARDIEEIVKNGDEDIFYSEDDKLKYIKYTNKKLSKESVFKGLSKVFTKTYVHDIDDGFIAYILGMLPGFALALGIIIMGTINFLPTMPWLIYLFAGVFDMAGAVIFGISLSTTIAQVIYRVFKWCALAIKNGVSKRQQKKRLKLIKNSVIESDLSEYMSEKVPESFNKDEEKDDEVTLKSEAKETARKILSKLPLLKDRELVEEYGTKLDELLNQCSIVSDSEYNSRYSEILYQLSWLDGEISESIKKELATHVMNSDYNRAKEQVESVSSTQLGSR